jgi:AbrB family looped-hinge helix DNA binding protein
MNAVTRLSSKGQIVIPKVTRERLGLRVGQPLEVVETADGVLLRCVATAGRISVDEAIRRLRDIITYDGPTVTIEEMNAAIREAGEEAAGRSDRAGR